jgi:predicted PurR-regulated permease PerM
MIDAASGAAQDSDPEPDLPEPDLHVERPGPMEMRDPLVRQELKRATVWIGCILLVAAVILLAQPLLLIVAGIVFAAMLDGGTRLLGRVLPIGRGWRLGIVALLAVAFLVGTIWFAGVELAGEAQTFRELITAQAQRAIDLAASYGMSPADVKVDQFAQQAMSGLGRLTSAVSSALGALTSFVMILVIGIFIAIEPRLYERGFAWMLPVGTRDAAYRTMAAVGHTLRHLMFGRLLGMLVEGVATWALLALGGVPLAALLGLLTGILAFIPNVGAIISGVLMVLIGFSAGTDTGLWAIGVYVAVQFIDGYLILPYVAKKTVDLAPALVLGAQLIFGALFGLMGLALADPLVAMIKATLQQKSVERDDVPMLAKAGPAPPQEPVATG